MAWKTTIIGYDEYDLPITDTVWEEDPVDYTPPTDYSDPSYWGTPVEETPVVDTSSGTDWTQYGYTDNGDGTYNFKDSAGNTYTINGATGQLLEQYNASGTSTAGLDSSSPLFDPTDPTGTGGTTSGGISGGSLSSLYDKAKTWWDSLSPKTRSSLTSAGLGIVAGYIDSKTGGNLVTPATQSSGYQGSIPTLAATRERVAMPYDPNRRPGSGGLRYFSDTKYTSPADAAAAKIAMAAQAGDLATRNAGITAAYNPATRMPLPREPIMEAQNQDNPGPGAGGDRGFAHGGTAARYLRGGTDGMADELPASIDNVEPAKLSHGEFVIPADVVSHLGNGNSDAGADKLYSMMEKIRKARTGNPKQGKRINPDKFLPSGAVGYAAGGGIKGFAGETGSTVPAGTTGTNQNLADWAGSYVTNMLGQAQALSAMPYEAYQGPLTAGASDLQTQGFQQAAGLSTPSSIGQAASTAGNIATTAQNLAPYSTGQFSTGTFGTDQAKQYMNPYLQASLDPQLAEARRQASISRVADAGRLTKAGAYGGSRQAIMEAEGNRNLETNLAGITGAGYNTAYREAMGQFNADQNRQLQVQQATEGSRQFGANLGLQGLNTALNAAQTQGSLGTAENQAGIANLNALLGAGATQRDIESQGIAADKAQFEEERANPYKMLQFQQSFLQGLPISAQQYQTAQPTLIDQLAALGKAGISLNDILNPSATTPP